MAAYSEAVVAVFINCGLHLQNMRFLLFSDQCSFCDWIERDSASRALSADCDERQTKNVIFRDLRLIWRAVFNFPLKQKLSS